VLSALGHELLSAVTAKDEPPAGHDDIWVMPILVVSHEPEKVHKIR
jgi:hypothetical protein